MILPEMDSLECAKQVSPSVTLVQTVSGLRRVGSRSWIWTGVRDRVHSLGLVVKAFTYTDCVGRDRYNPHLPKCVWVTEGILRGNESGSAYFSKAEEVEPTERSSQRPRVL